MRSPDRRRGGSNDRDHERDLFLDQLAWIYAEAALDEFFAKPASRPDHGESQMLATPAKVEP